VTRFDSAIDPMDPGGGPFGETQNASELNPIRLSTQDRARSLELLERRQSLFEFEHRFEQIARFLTLLRTSSLRNVSEPADLRLRQSATSFHVTGVETVGRSFARSEYTFTVVL
jgi:hypothetical protein